MKNACLMSSGFGRGFIVLGIAKPVVSARRPGIHFVKKGTLTCALQMNRAWRVSGVGMKFLNGFVQVAVCTVLDSMAAGMEDTLLRLAHFASVPRTAL